MSAWEIYWLLKLDDIRFLFYITAFAGGAVSFTYGLMWLVTAEEILRSNKLMKVAAEKCLRFSLPALAIALTAIALIPSTKQMAAVLVVPPVVNNERVQQIPEKILDIVEKKINELKDE